MDSVGSPREKQNLISDKELQAMLVVAQKAALSAGEIQTKNFRRQITVSEKAGAGLVTEVDLRSEALILKLLQKNFPQIPIIGEESGVSGSLDRAGPAWHVDPLDGTTNYAHGFPVYAVSIGLAIGNRPILGVVHAPSLRETWLACEGQGAFLNGKQVSVSKRKTLRAALLATGFAYTRGAPLSLAIERFRQFSMRARAVRRPGAAALDLAYLASGVYDGFWETRLSSWDVCAGVCLVREAGGAISDFQGQDFTFAAREILGSNQLIHRNMIRVLRKGEQEFALNALQRNRRRAKRRPV